MDAAALASTWSGTLAGLGAAGPVQDAGGRLLAAYQEPHRAYHDLLHLDEVLSRVAELSADADTPDVVRLAAWFHDAVYDPRAGDNEQRSAAWASTLLPRLGLSPAVVAEVGRLVRLTAGHQADPADRDGAVLCDADLAVLAASPDRYGAYAAGVRREYGHLDEAAFRSGRARVLRALLERPALFATGPGRARWEAAARRNVQGELLLLEAEVSHEVSREVSRGTGGDDAGPRHAAAG